MIEQRTIELIHLVLDGEADAVEIRKLQADRERSPEVESLFREMEELAARLEAAVAEPPSDMPENVLAMIGAQRSPGAESSLSGGGSRPLPFAPRRWVAVALAAAAGVILVLTAVPLIDSRFPVDRKSASGAIQPPGPHAWAVIARAESAETGAGLVVRRRGDQIAVIPSPGAEVSGAVSIRWDGEQMELVEILSEVREDAPYTDKGEAIFIAGELSPIFVLRPLPQAAGRTAIGLFLGNQNVVSVQITVD